MDTQPMDTQQSLFVTVPGHDGAPPKLAPAIEARPRDRATVAANHRANQARARATYDDLLREYLGKIVTAAERRGGGAWSAPFRFEQDADLPLSPGPDGRADTSAAAYLRRRLDRWPAPDTCRRRGTALADEMGIELHNENGRGVYRARTKR